MNQRPSESESHDGDDAVIAVAFRRSMYVLGFVGMLVTAVFFAGRYLRKEEAEVVGPTVTPTVRTYNEVEVPPLPMAEIAADAGIRFIHNSGAIGEKLLPETMGSGCAFIDYDNDGDQDLFLVNGTDWSWDSKDDSSPTRCALYANDGSGKFTDVSQQSGADIATYGMGVAVGDYDNDGWNDLFISGVGTGTVSEAGPCRLLKNIEGKFTDVTESAGVQGAGDCWGTSCGFADYDNDGLLDLFVCNYVDWSRETDLSQSFTIDGTNRKYGPPQAFNGTFPVLYHNEGGGEFKDVSAAAGVQIENRVTNVPLAKGMGLAPVDINADGWIDFIVANDTVRNLLFINSKDGTFSETSELANIAYDRDGKARGAMGIDVARFRDDGTLAVCIGNFANEMSALYLYRPRRNQFFDAAMATGLGPPTRKGLTFGMLFCDVDLDGRYDVIGANGHLEEDIAKIQKTQTYEQPLQLFWNAGADADSELVHVPSEKTGEAFHEPIVGRGVALADIDADGDTDFVVTTNGGPIRLFRNEQACGNHWIRIKLMGTKSNRNAIGAIVSVHAGGTVFRSHVMPTRSYLSQAELPITFGLGMADTIDKIQIVWPSGTEQVIDDAAIDSVLEIVES